MKRILYIAYHFPPQGGAGVQRSLKFVKYLPEFGIDPVVLTGRGTHDAKWSPPDATLLGEIPSGIRVMRSPWPETDGHDRRSGEDIRFEAASREIEENSIEAILVSMSPFSDAGLAAALSARHGIPWVADLRDPWALDEFQSHRTAWHRLRARRRMRSDLRTASLVIMNTPESARALVRAFPEYDRKRVVSITNGFDAEDFSGLATVTSGERFTIVHAGFLHTSGGLRQRKTSWRQRLLGQIDPGVRILPRSHYYLVAALETWLREEPDLPNRIRFVLVGEPREADRALVARSPAASLVEFTGYLNHRESIARLASADLLFLPMHTVAPGRRATIVPGKLYEYLASGKPVLAAVPPGDARDFLARAGTASLCAPEDTAALGAALRRHFARWMDGGPTPPVDRDFVDTFERRALTSRLARELLRLPSPAAHPALVRYEIPR